MAKQISDQILHRESQASMFMHETPIWPILVSGVSFGHEVKPVGVRCVNAFTLVSAPLAPNSKDRSVVGECATACHRLLSRSHESKRTIIGLWHA